MKKILLGLPWIASVIMVSSVQAFQYQGSTTTTIPVNSINNLANHSNNLKTKEVKVMKIKLSKNEKQKLFESLSATVNKDDDSNENEKLPKSYDAGMNGTPVLDQGRHGTCVTFAATAAVDAVWGKGDYVSQLCQLELGKYLEARGSLPSGWDGSLGDIVLHQMTQFGIVNKETQNASGCAGVNAYPLTNEDDTGSEMSLDEFKQKSEPLLEKIAFDPMLTPTQFFSHPNKPNQEIVKEVKKVLLSNEKAPVRVIISTLLDLNYGHAGASASYHANQDTWALTEEIKNDPIPNEGGHELVVIGYDDKAVAIDTAGKKHTGLFILRNSWGNEAGDQGNYYMTYDYFTHFVFEINQVMRDNG